MTHPFALSIQALRTKILPGLVRLRIIRYESGIVDSPFGGEPVTTARCVHNPDVAIFRPEESVAFCKVRGEGGLRI